MNPETAIERLIEMAADNVRTVTVELVRVLHEVQGVAEDRRVSEVCRPAPLRRVTRGSISSIRGYAA